ncbi:hypothetical protein C0J52_16366, partial [Blattella germanica]
QSGDGGDVTVLGDLKAKCQCVPDFFCNCRPTLAEGIMQLHRPVDRSKTYELLKTSWSYQTQEYFDNSTLHGVRYINEDGRPTCEKFMWFCFTSVGGVVTLIIIVSLWEKFQTNPTITGLDTDFHNWDVPFPTVSLCPVQPVDPKAVDAYIEKNFPSVDEEKKKSYAEFLTQVGSISYENINKFLELKPLDGIDTSNFRKIVEEVVVKCKNFIGYCNYKGKKIDCCQRIKPLLTEVGYCFSFNSKFAAPLTGEEDKKKDFVLEYIYETDHAWSIKMNMSIKIGGSDFVGDQDNSSTDATETTNIRVYLHSAHDYPVVDESPQHIWDTVILKLLFGSKETYTTDVGYKYCDLAGLQCIAKIVGKFLHTTNCHCELGCSNTVYEVEKLTGELIVQEEKTQLHKLCKEKILIFIFLLNSNGSLEIGFVSWPMVRYKREVLFGWVDLLVSFGGIAGLFLGFSLLSGIEVIYYFTMRAICMVYRDKEDLLKLREEYDKAVKPPLDLRLTPTFMRKNEGESNKNPRIPSVSAKVGHMLTVPQRSEFELARGIAQRNSQVVSRGNIKPMNPRYSKFEFLP